MIQTELLPFWPTQDNVLACIKPEAETIDEAVFLAVHQPMVFKRRRIGSAGESETCTEGELLKAFLTKDLPEGRLILPVIGSSGIGKSHVIRWLHAQLRRLPDAETRHIIRIPKGSSLKRVLRLILEDLKGKAYDTIRKALMTAREHLDPELAARQLQTNLRHQLVLLGREAKARNRENRSKDPEKDKMRGAYCAENALPALLGDPVLEEHHFLRTKDKKGVVALLAEHVTTEGGSDIDERRHQFEPADLILPDFIDLPSLSKPARDFYQILNKEQGRHRQVATEILNEVLDGAKQELLSLGENPLTDLFADVRAQLHREGRELVLLVEDFAVLSGLQGALLDVMIREAFRDGKQELCTMRSALAYTEGYLTRETVRTRARVEWLIEDTPGSEEQMFQRTENLVGSYLNAARVGQAQLKAALPRQSTNGTLHDWIPRFEVGLSPEAEAVLKEFGESEDLYALFPFNKDAIRQMAHEGSQDSLKRFVFNPRNIINNVITQTLSSREAFERQEFPPADTGERSPLEADIIEFLKRQVPDHDVRRYRKFLTYWGGMPRSVAEVAAVPRALYTAFGLAPLNVEAEQVPRARAPQPTQRAKERQEKPQPSPEQPAVAGPEEKWRSLLTSWHDGQLLEQKDANLIRKSIEEGVLRYIRWNWIHLRIRPDDLTEIYRYVFIPGAKGQGAIEYENALIPVCDEEARRDPEKSAPIRRELLAIIKFHEIYKSWDYEGSEVDSAYYAEFMSRHADRVRDYVAGRPLKAQADIVPALVQGLLVGARALGVEGAGQASLPSVVNAMLEPLAPARSGPPNASPSKWDTLLDQLRKLRRTEPKRRAWNDLLLDHVGARQGRGADVFAIDIARLVDPIKAVMKSWTVDVQLPESNTATDEYRILRQELSEIRRLMPSAVKEEQSYFNRWRAAASAWLGEPFDKDTKDRTVAELEETLRRAKASGLTHDVDDRRLRELIHAFRDSAVIAALDDASKLKADATLGSTLSVLARDHHKTALLIERLMVDVDDFLKKYNQALAAEEKKYGKAPVEEARSALLHELEGLETLLRQCGELSS